jgi:LPS export ABC transporter protein LptC
MVTPGNIRLLLAVLTVTMIIGILAAISFKSLRQPSSKPAPQQLPRNIDSAMHHARFSEMRDGAPVWELIAERAELDNRSDLANLTTIRMEFAATRSAGAITVTAEKGTFSNGSRNVVLRGKVHMQTASGISFDSEALDYLAASSLFRTSLPVTFRDHRLTLQAVGMEMRVPEQTCRFFSKIDAIVLPVRR